MNYDIVIDYAAGEALAFLQPFTTAGRHFLSDNVKGRKLNKVYLSEPQELLALLAKMEQANIVAHWRTKQN